MKKRNAMIKYTFIMLFLTILLSCEEEKQPVINNDVIKFDTVAIGEYFPVYPNSFWIYFSLNGDTIIHKTDSSYSLINNPFDTTKFYVPIYDGLPVIKYKIHTGYHSYRESGWENILPDSLYVGNLFLKLYVYPTTYYTGKIQTIDTSLLINSIYYDSVITVLEYCGPSFGTTIPFGKTYYAKNIGIIKTERCNYQSFDSIFSEEFLIEYLIGN